MLYDVVEQSEAPIVTHAFALSRRTVLFAPVALVACKRSATVLDFSGQTMGTSYKVVAIDHGRSVAQDELTTAVDTVLAEVNAQMSNWDTNSEVSRLNETAHTTATQVSPEMAQVLSAANDVHDATEGQFDVALGPLIEAWGFGAGPQQPAAPSDAAIEKALASAGRAAPLLVSGNAVYKTNADTQVYLSAIGKGHGVDRVAKVLQEFGIEDYLVEIGGDLVTAGRNAQGRPWQIGIETPDALDRRVQQVVGISGMGMATSGDYRNYFEKDGTRYSHILDAATGRPVTHATTSATVLSDSAMLSDAWATAMLTLGRDRGMDIATALNLAVLFIDRDAAGNGFESLASPAYLELAA